MDAIITTAMLNGVGVVGVVLAIGLMVFRGHLIPGKWHKEAMEAQRTLISRAEDRADRWEAVALRALDATERLTEPVSIAAKVMTQLPVVMDEEGP